jgi:hypothetical protein
MRNISFTLFLLLLALAHWLPRLLPFGGRVRGILALALVAAALPFLFWPVMAPVTKPVEIALDLPLFALLAWAGVLLIKGDVPRHGER